MIRDAAHAYARAGKAMVCWTLGITEHHNAVDNVLALINLSLLTGHVGRWGCGCNPLRGQNNVQGGGDMGAIPNKLPGFQDIETDHAARARIGALWGATIPPTCGHEPDADAARDVAPRSHRALRHRREPGAVRRRRASRRRRAAADSITSSSRRSCSRARPSFAHVVLPAAATWCEGEGTVTNSERRVQRVRKATEPPAGARDELWIIAQIAKRLGHDWGSPTAEAVWNEFRLVAPHFAGGMSYARLDALGGIQWPCPDESHPGETFLHGRLWEVPCGGRPAPFSVVHHDPPVERLDAEFPLLLTTGRRLESYNTGVQTSGYDSPLHFGETLDISPEDAARLGIADGDHGRDRLAPRPRHRAGAHRHHAPRGHGVHDAALPRRGGDEPLDDRRLRSEVRHRRVQGLRGPRRARGGFRAGARGRALMDIQAGRRRRDG